MPDWPLIRQLEAVSFRSWPATTTRYDGTWAIRLTKGHPAKRLNSVNPLDPADNQNLEQRIQSASRLFKEQGRPLVFRLSPLAPTELVEHFDQQNWSKFDESLVMITDLTRLDLSSAQDRLPFNQLNNWVDQFMTLNREAADRKPGLTAVINAIHTPVAPFLIEDDQHKALAVALCVRTMHLAGLFEVISHVEKRGQGLGRDVVTSALKWAKQKGARQAWLQVTAQNAPALALYRSLGFKEVYRYVYCSPGDSG